MVYKKYIKKNGKLYGPYLYHSKRINGKVVSEYHGINKLSYKKLIIFSIGIISLILLFVLFFNSNTKITGRTIENPEVNPQLQNSLSEQETIYPIVYFTLVSKQIPVSDSAETGTEQDENEPDSQNEQNIIDTQESNENQTYENETNIENSEENTTIASQQNESNDVTQPNTTENSTISENTPEIESSDAGIPSGSTAEQESTSTTETTQDNEQSEEDNKDEGTETSDDINQADSAEKDDSTNQYDGITSQESSDTDTSSDTSAESAESEETTTSVPVSIILGMLKTVSNFFLSLTPTGMTISEPIITEINGQVSFDEPFTYNLKEGETINLLSGSVRTDSESLPDDTIQITKQDNQIMINTNYSETESDYTINQTNETELLNLTNDFYVEPITEEENLFLAEKLGNISVEKVKSELFNGRYIIEYEFGKYGIEYSYDANLNNETLKMQIENDKIKWVRDIIKELSKNKSIAQSVDL